MKKITEADIDSVKKYLENKRKEFEKLNLSLEESLKWIQNFFNEYVPELEEKYLAEEELKCWIFLPDELRVWFYIYFPEHGLNMANLSQELFKELSIQKNTVSRFNFFHWD